MIPIAKFFWVGGSDSKFLDRRHPCPPSFFESRSFRALAGLLFALVGPSLGRTKYGLALLPFDLRFFQDLETN